MTTNLKQGSQFKYLFTFFEGGDLSAGFTFDWEVRIIPTERFYCLADYGFTPAGASDLANGAVEVVIDGIDTFKLDFDHVYLECRAKNGDVEYRRGVVIEIEKSAIGRPATQRLEGAGFQTLLIPYIEAGSILVPLSTGASAAVNTTATTTAMSTAVEGDVLVFPYGRFLINNFSVTKDFLTFKGAGQARWDDVNSVLKGGTILEGGTIDVAQKYGCEINGLSVDVSGVSARDAIRSGNNLTSTAAFDQGMRVANVSTHGSGSNHGCVMTSGDNNLLENFEAYEFDHGGVLRCGHSQANNIKTKDCSVSSFTIKANDACTPAVHNKLSNLTGRGTTTSDNGGLTITAHDGNNTEYNNISNVSMDKCTYGIRCDTVDNGSGHGATRRNMVVNATIDSPLFDGVRVDGVADYNIFQITVNGNPNNAANNAGTGVNNDIMRSNLRSSGGSIIAGVWRTSDYN